MVGREARSRGFNVLLAGGINLARDPRNGRNFEYLSEDPLLSAVLAAESINGIQGEGVISTIKHFSLNCNETNRHWLDAIIDPAAHRESDLLAFEIAIERSQPGSVMTGYNKINGEYAGGNRAPARGRAQGRVGLPGLGDVRLGRDARAGSSRSRGSTRSRGVQIDVMMWEAEAFTEPLREAYAEGELPKERLSDMVRRILRSIYAVGIDAWGPAPEVDMAAHDEIALETARQGIVLLKNDGVLPLAADTTARIAVIGGHAQLGVPTGTGSSAVIPPGGFAAVITIGGPGIMGGIAQPVPAPVVAARGAARSCLPNARDRVRPRDEPGRGGAAGAALGRRDRVRDPRRGRGLRQRRPVAAVGPGRGDRGRRGGEPEHDRRARDRQPGRHAVARQGAGRSSRPGTRARPAARRSPRC